MEESSFLFSSFYQPLLIAQLLQTAILPSDFPTPFIFPINPGWERHTRATGNNISFSMITHSALLFPLCAAYQGKTSISTVGTSTSAYRLSLATMSRSNTGTGTVWEQDSEPSHQASQDTLSRTDEEDEESMWLLVRDQHTVEAPIMQAQLCCAGRRGSCFEQ